MYPSKKLPITLLPKVRGLKLEEVAMDTEVVSLSVESSCPSAASPISLAGERPPAPLTPQRPVDSPSSG